MIIIDSHLDLAWNALNWNRDLTQPVSEIRRLEAQMKEEHRGGNTVSFPEMRKGNVAICLATLLARASGLGEVNLDFRTCEAASAMACGQLAYYRIMASRGWLRMLKRWQDVEAHLRDWQETGANPAPLGFILSMEGADPILSPADVVDWWNDGLRVVGPAHYGVSAYAHGTGVSGGLTDKGPDLLKAMDEVGMVLDVTHMADESFWQALKIFKGPVLASHNNCRALVPGQRQFSDEQFRALIERGAVIGVAFDSWMLYPGYDPGKTPNSLVKLEAVADHIDHICQLAGNTRQAAIGSDLDGGFGTEQSPHDLDTIADIQKIPAILRKRGYSGDDIEAVMQGNWFRYFRETWKGLRPPS